MDVHAAWHDDHAVRVDSPGRLGEAGNHAPVGDANIPDLAVDAVRGIVDGPVDDAEAHAEFRMQNAECSEPRILHLHYGTTTVIRSTDFISPTINSCA